MFQVSGTALSIPCVRHSATEVGLPDGEWSSVMLNCTETTLLPARAAVWNWKNDRYRTARSQDRPTFAPSFRSKFQYDWLGAISLTCVHSWWPADQDGSM